MKNDADANQGSLIPAATIILLREQGGALQTLLLRRNPGDEPFAGAWVFPGGAIETADGSYRAGDAWPLAARPAAVRELREETGLSVFSQDPVPFACWISPTRMPRRFRTWFCLAAAPPGVIRLCRKEVNAYCWAAPQQVLNRHRTHGMVLFPPTWVFLRELTGIQSVTQALGVYARRTPACFNSRVRTRDADMCFFYEGDAAYGEFDLDRPGSRHRLWTSTHGWRYERKP
jgi:8-oxo-dGTP pyrophosphatase MutT (NUDIX family)